MDRPLAVTVEKPRFSWEWDAEENNVYQSAYQIIVQKEDGVLVWDSTRTAGRDTTDIEYAGQPLEPRRRYLYRITAWDQEGREAKSGQEYFETALWKEEDWKASWIEPDPLPQLETVPLKAAGAVRSASADAQGISPGKEGSAPYPRQCGGTAGTGWQDCLLRFFGRGASGRQLGSALRGF